MYPWYEANNELIHYLDMTCKECENIFKSFDPNATILPGIGLPSQNKGVCTITHRMPGAPNLIINGLESKSPIANNALFSTESTGGTFLNLYEMMLPEGKSPIPGKPSAAELYVKDLGNLGLNVAGVHFHWWGTTPFVAAIHHQNAGMNPVDFCNRTVEALRRYSNRVMV